MECVGFQPAASVAQQLTQLGLGGADGEGYGNVPRGGGREWPPEPPRRAPPHTRYYRAAGQFEGCEHAKQEAAHEEGEAGAAGGCSGGAGGAGLGLGFFSGRGLGTAGLVDAAQVQLVCQCGHVLAADVAGFDADGTDQFMAEAACFRESCQWRASSGVMPLAAFDGPDPDRDQAEMVCAACSQLVGHYGLFGDL